MTRLSVDSLLSLLTSLAFVSCSDYPNRPSNSSVEPLGGAGTAGTSGQGNATAGASATGSSGAAGTEGNIPSVIIPGAGGTGSNTAGAGATASNGGSAATISRGEGPCDVYATGNTPCVAAYSMVRALSSSYEGPLYQVRRDAPNPFQNTGVGGVTQDIGMLPNGFADAAAQDAFCGELTCTVSVLYDQSGRGNNLTVAKAGRSDGGQFADDDDFESTANAGPLTVGGNNVYSLYMEARHGYRQIVPGDGVPLLQEPQGIYMLADGTRVGTACCWDFGNVTPNPTEYHTMNTLFLGQAFWGRGAGAGPWFMADFEAGVWAGGSNPGEPGWGALNDPAPPNPANPSLPVPFALGFLKTATNYALRMADLDTATSLITAYEGPLPKPMDNQGAIVIGVGGDNSNNSFGTFFEGAVVAGYPSNDVELAVMQNIQAVGYGQ